LAVLHHGKLVDLDQRRATALDVRVLTSGGDQPLA
jgi:hypothetical protein